MKTDLFGKWKQTIQGLKDRDKAVYQRIKHKSSVQKLISFAAIDDIGVTLLNIEKINESLAKGWQFNEGLSQGISCPLAYLLMLEEKCDKEIITFQEFKECAQLTSQDENVAMSIYYYALEQKYIFVLQKILRDGGKYKDLLAANPKNFGIDWEINKQEIIHFVLGSYIEEIETDCLTDSREPPSLWRIARVLEAPHSEMKAASKFYSV